jgi:tRNA threonylcarbamoyladenosine biosynthesis protein TsaB
MKRSVILHIDTSDNTRVVVGLTLDGVMKTKEQHATRWTSQMLLPMIEDCIKTHGLSLSDLTEISCNIGPGSYTGLRVGIAVSNALSILLDIPVNGKRDPLIPVYQ